LGWFATAKGTSSKLLFERTSAAIDAGELDAEIVVVFCNRDRGQSANTDAFLDLVEGRGTPLVTLSSGEWRKRVDGTLSKPGEPLAPWRRDYEAEARRLLEPYAPEVSILAGFMLIAPDLCEWLPLLNLHPALPDGPVGTWREVIRELITNEAEASGMIFQRSTRELDRGPVVSSCRYSIREATLAPLWETATTPLDEEGPLFRAIRALGVEREPHFIIASLQAIADGRVPIPNPDEPGPNLNLTTDVERALARERAE
jgi:folate-dependent phosphoribosylglycinamide formyltransferase PurN